MIRGIPGTATHGLGGRSLFQARARRGEGILRVARTVVGAAALVLASACSLGTDAPDRPTTVRVRVDGTVPRQLALITSTDFYETYSYETGLRSAVVVTADTARIGVPHDSRLDISDVGSVYVELRNLTSDSVTVRFRVELDNGQGSDRTATLLDSAGLVYYYVYRQGWY